MITSHDNEYKLLAAAQIEKETAYRTSLVCQATFFRSLAAAVRCYKETQAPIIVMDWLISELEDAAAECDLEAENQEV